MNEQTEFKTQFGKLVSCDLFEGTLTIKVESEYIEARRGEYAVVPKEHFLKIMERDHLGSMCDLFKDANKYHKGLDSDFSQALDELFLSKINSKSCNADNTSPEILIWKEKFPDEEFNPDDYNDWVNENPMEAYRLSILVHNKYKNT